MSLKDHLSMLGLSEGRTMQSLYVAEVISTFLSFLHPPLCILGLLVSLGPIVVDLASGLCLNTLHLTDLWSQVNLNTPGRVFAPTTICLCSTLSVIYEKTLHCAQGAVPALFALDCTEVPRMTS